MKRTIKLLFITILYVFWGLITILWVSETLVFFSGAFSPPYGVNGIVRKGASIDPIKITKEGEWELISVKEATELVSAGYLFYIGLIYAEIIFVAAYFLIKHKRSIKVKMGSLITR